MAFELHYRTFGTLNIWHGYHLHPNTVDNNSLNATEQLERVTGEDYILDSYKVQNYLRIVPTSLTKTLMNGLKIQARTVPNGLKLWVQANHITADVWTPFIRLTSPIKLTFLMEYNSPEFLNYTEVSESIGKEQVLYFSNEVNNIEAGLLYLNQTGNYISRDDLIEIQGVRFSVTMVGMGVNIANFEMRNAFGNASITCRSPAEEPELVECSLSWESLSSGKYEFIATNLDTGDLLFTRYIYLNREESKVQRPLGVIEWIVDPATIASPYGLIASDQRLRSPIYTLWWQNRMTWWRYVLNTIQEPSVNPDVDCDVVFEAASRNRLITKSMQPLIQGVRPICFRQDRTSTPGVNEEIQLPNPGKDQIYPEVDGRIFSEVYLGALNFNQL